MRFLEQVAVVARDEHVLLSGVPLLARLPATVLEPLGRRLEPVLPRTSEDAIAQGQAGDRFYVIASRKVDAYEDGIHARREGPGDHVGEIGPDDFPSLAAL